MLSEWDRAIVTDINLAIRVEAGSGSAVHTNRAYHGLVLNDVGSEIIYHFSDGSRLRTGPYEVFYLPKGSSYRVESITSGGCWAINFDLAQDLEQMPLSMSFRSHEAVLKAFREAVGAWTQPHEFRNTVVRKCIYTILFLMHAEYSKTYTPSAKEQLIRPALEVLHRDFTDNALTVQALAELCGISQAYFRRIFCDCFSLSPKEYITALRMEHARHLLESGQFSVAEVARMCGYYEACHFSREFRKYTGLAPSSYAKSAGQIRTQR